MLRRNSEVARMVVIAGCFLALGVPSTAQTAMTDLARARAHYNQREFDDAITAATAARQAPETADAAGIVLARAHLERYRERADPADLSAAREVLGVIHASTLDPRDQVELLLADCRKAKELVGYEPRVSLEEGLQKTWAYVLERIADYRPDEYAI